MAASRKQKRSTAPRKPIQLAQDHRFASSIVLRDSHVRIHHQNYPQSKHACHSNSPTYIQSLAVSRQHRQCHDESCTTHQRRNSTNTQVAATHMATTDHGVQHGIGISQRRRRQQCPSPHWRVQIQRRVWRATHPQYEAMAVVEIWQNERSV